MHAMEWLDFPWFPRRIRDYATDYLSFVTEKSGMMEPVYEKIEGLLIKTGKKLIVDLGAGGGGPSVGMARYLEQKGNDAKIILTDLHPVHGWVLPDSVKVYRESVSMIDPPEWDCIYTMYNAFHHLRPHEARHFLSDSARKRRNIVIVEANERRAVNFIAMFLIVPILSAISSLFIRPFRIGRIFFSLLFPLVPLLIVWDGIASLIRIYMPDDLKTLTSEIQEPQYHWKIEKVRVKKGASVILLTGHPSDFSVDG